MRAIPNQKEKTGILMKQCMVRKEISQDTKTTIKMKPLRQLPQHRFREIGTGHSKRVMNQRTR